jgi:hypothetical protein
VTSRWPFRAAFHRGTGAIPEQRQNNSVVTATLKQSIIVLVKWNRLLLRERIIRADARIIPGTIDGIDLSMKKARKSTALSSESDSGRIDTSTQR